MTDDFAAICLPHQSELYGVAMRMTRDPDDASDLVQETMLHAMLAWDRFDGVNLRAWLFRILTNEHINRYRRRKCHARFSESRPDDIVVGLYGDRAFHDPAPDEGFSDEVRGAVDRLDTDHREIIERVDLQDGLYREVAADLGVPIGTVMSRLHRARAKLADKLSGFAQSEYGLRGGAGVDASRVEATQAVQTEADCVQSIVRVRHDGTFSG